MELKELSVPHVDLTYVPSIILDGIERENLVSTLLLSRFQMIILDGIERQLP